MTLPLKCDNAAIATITKVWKPDDLPELVTALVNAIDAATVKLRDQ